MRVAPHVELALCGIALAVESGGVYLVTAIVKSGADRVIAEFTSPTTRTILARHNPNVVGYWTGDDNTFVFLLSHASRDEAKKNWAAMLEKAEIVFIRATDFSPMK